MFGMKSFRNGINHRTLRRLAVRAAKLVLGLGIITVMYISYFQWSPMTNENTFSKTDITQEIMLNGTTEEEHRISTLLNPTPVTVVSAFFDIGSFGKGSQTISRTPDTYLDWAKTFEYLLNPLVVYTDSLKFYYHVLKLRAKLEFRTKVLMLNRTSSWAFQRRDEIKEIFSRKDYPKYYPNTVLPEYPCAMHAKYDVISRAATKNYFHTHYFMWLDVGLFRAKVDSKIYFKLELPPNFNDSRVAVSQVYDPSMSLETSVIMKRKLDWICGCIFLARRDVILKYAEQYKMDVDFFLSQKLMNSDQQILYTMYSKSGRTKFRTRHRITRITNLCEQTKSMVLPWISYEK